MKHFGRLTVFTLALGNINMLRISVVHVQSVDLFYLRRKTLYKLRNITHILNILLGMCSQYIHKITDQKVHTK